MRQLIEKSLTALLAVAAICAGAFAPIASAQAQAAQDYPRRPVSIVVPFAAGGATDISARAIAALLTKQLGQPFVVENKAGASGLIGMGGIARAAPDGYTLGWAVNTSMTVAPYLVKNPPYDPLKAFAPISVAGVSSWVFITRNDLPVKTMPEFIALAKAQPGKLNFASSGTGSAPHLLGEMLKTSAGIDAVHIPFKGESESVAALLAGTIDFMMISKFIATPLVATNKVKILAVSTPQRDPTFPTIPTVTEVGIPALTFEIFYGLVAPAGTPAPVLAKLEAAIKLAVTDPGYKETMEKGGIRATSNTPEEFSGLIKSHSERWQGIIKRNNISIE